MKNVFFAFVILASLNSYAVGQSHSSRELLTGISSAPTSETAAVISTNLADITKNRANVSVDVMITRQAAATLSYASNSEKEVRKNIDGEPKLTVDRTQFGIGADFYFRPLTSLYNFAISPSLIFQNEKDALETESSNGVGVRAVGIFKPNPRIMAQGGLISKSIGSESTSDVVIGMGLLF